MTEDQPREVEEVVQGKVRVQAVPSGPRQAAQFPLFQVVRVLSTHYCSRHLIVQAHLTIQLLAVEGQWIQQSWWPPVQEVQRQCVVEQAELHVHQPGVPVDDRQRDQVQLRSAELVAMAAAAADEFVLAVAIAVVVVVAVAVAVAVGFVLAVVARQPDTGAVQQRLEQMHRVWEVQRQLYVLLVSAMTVLRRL